VELHALAEGLQGQGLRLLHVAEVALGQLLLGGRVYLLVVLDHEGEALVRGLGLGQLLHIRHAGSLALATWRGGNGGGTRRDGRVEDGLGQAHTQVVAGHLVLLRVGRHNGQELEQHVQDFPVLVRQQEHGTLHRIQTHFGGEIWG